VPRFVRDGAGVSARASPGAWPRSRWHRGRSVDAGDPRQRRAPARHALARDALSIAAGGPRCMSAGQAPAADSKRTDFEVVELVELELEGVGPRGDAC